MLARNETIFKWSLYGAATLALFLLQGLVLQRIELWGVFPFLFPVEVAILASYEGPLPGTVFGLVLGVCCDLTVTAAIPCFYTLIFPVVGLAAAAIAGSVISAGPVCSLACSEPGPGRLGRCGISDPAGDLRGPTFFPAGVSALLRRVQKVSRRRLAFPLP